MRSCLSATYKYKILLLLPSFLPIPFIAHIHFMLWNQVIMGRFSRSMKQCTWKPLRGQINPDIFAPLLSPWALCHVPDGNHLCECSIHKVLQEFDMKDTVWWNSWEALLNLNRLHNAKHHADSANTISTVCYSEEHYKICYVYNPVGWTSRPWWIIQKSNNYGLCGVRVLW